MFVDKVLSACCGDSSLVNAMKTKLPWHKDGVNDDEVAHQAPINMGQHKKKGKFTDKETKHELLQWKKLPLKVRHAAEDLGYDATKWDEAADLPIEHKHWHDLSEKEMKAAGILGWEKDAWEHKYEHFDWDDLPELQKKAAEAAGFTKHDWDDDHWPENLDMRWDDITEEDRQAMAVLGWSKRTWD